MEISYKVLIVFANWRIGTEYSYCRIIFLVYLEGMKDSHFMSFVELKQLVSSLFERAIKREVFFAAVRNIFMQPPYNRNERG